MNAGANPNKADIEKKTPLHMATIHGNLDVYKVLRAGGGDPHRMDKYGRMPELYADPLTDSCNLQ